MQREGDDIKKQLVEQVFAESEMLELCTPVINPKGGDEFDVLVGGPTTALPKKDGVLVFQNDRLRLTTSRNLEGIHHAIRCDYMLSKPRIAVVGESHTLDQLFDSCRSYEAFDILVVENTEQAMQLLNAVSDSPVTVALLESDVVYTMAYGEPTIDEQSEQSMRSAIYLAIDIFRHRHEYTKAYANPLQKLFHERPDSGEKIRFAIPPKKETVQ